ncbi:MAG: hypothetical protein ACK4IY_06035, partial [Chitinophagales bacterium]
MKKYLLLILIGIGLIYWPVSETQAQYCIPDYTYGPIYGDYCDGVVLGDISNFSGAGSEYNDYTYMSTL